MIKIIKELKQKMPVIFTLFILPLIITTSAFCIDIAEVTLFSFLVSFSIIFALFALVYGAFEKIWAAWFITSIPVFLLEIINFYKLKINGVPFVISDFSFISGIGEIAKFSLPQIKITFSVIASLTGFVLFSALIIFAESLYRKHKFIRLYSLGISILICLVLFIPFSHRLIAQNEENKDFSPQQLVTRYGVIAGFYCSATTEEEAVMTLTHADIKPYIDSYEKSKNEEKPTVIFLMSESFFDIDRLPGLSYSKDPIPTFHKLQQEYSSGNFLSIQYCGGTGYVEMEFLTGLCSRFLENGHTLDNLPEKGVYKYIPSIGDIFKANGYTTSFIHSYNTNLYNRPFIYSSFEFDNVIFDTDFKTPINEYSGGYISDMTLMDEIIATYESNDDGPSMIYAISMENHQPFLIDKYDKKSDIEIYGNLSAEDAEAYEVFLHGLNNADKALAKLIDYFSKVDEPVVIAFWGDHLPNLTMPSGTSIYKQTGYCDDTNPLLECEDYYNQLTTDYVIWSNYGLEKVDKPLGCPTFAIEVMEKTGIEMNDYFKWMSSRMKDTYLVLSYYVFASADGSCYPNIPEQHKKVMDEYKQVVYDIVYGEHKLFGKQR